MKKIPTRETKPKPKPGPDHKAKARGLVKELLEIIEKLLEIIGDTKMGKAELDAALLAQTAAVAQLNNDANRIIADNPSDALTAETQQVNDNTTTVKQVTDNLNAAFPPPVTPTPVR